MQLRIDGWVTLRTQRLPKKRVQNRNNDARFQAFSETDEENFARILVTGTLDTAVLDSSTWDSENIHHFVLIYEIRSLSTGEDLMRRDLIAEDNSWWI